MSEMEAVNVNVMKSPDRIQDATPEDRVALLKERGHKYEDEDYEPWSPTVMEIDGVVWELCDKHQLDACGFEMTRHIGEDAYNITALWYNGGAGLHEVLESAIKNQP